MKWMDHYEAHGRNAALTCRQTCYRERAQRTHTEEFYGVVEFAPEITPPQPRTAGLEHTYNTLRPHQVNRPGKVGGSNP